ncbi:MAG TPA: OmpA family protein [Chitinophagales bacterium]|nr:OmpA family protein [Chitinophagales bacterium]
MKKNFIRSLLVITACLLLGAQETFSQARQLRKGDKASALFQFGKAIKFYERVLSKHPAHYKALSQLADVYRITGDYENALKWYSEIVKTPECSPVQKFYYAQMLRTAEQYDSAKVYYLKYADLVSGDPRGKRLADGIDLIPQWLKDSVNFRVMEFPHNSPVSDFSPAYYKGDSAIVFVSARGTGKIDELWSGTPFLDLFVSEKTDTGYTVPVPLPGNVNREYHEGPLTLDSTFTTMYFTRNNYIKRKKKKGSEGIMKLKVFKAEFRDGKWTEILDLPFNSNEYSVGHPTLSPDGKYLYFASDMPNENAQGGQDLYYVEITSTGFDTPVNLGPGINTKGDEVFPFMHKSGTLYFSSDSYEGFGGLDIYSATKNAAGEWGSVTNLGYPINSSKDDFGLIYSDKIENGYFSSNRPGGSGSDDIYVFDKKVTVILIGKVIDKKTKEPIPDALVKVMEVPSEKIDSLMADAKGKFQFNLSINEDYTVTADKYGYFLVSPKEVSTREAGKDTIEVVLELQGISVGEVVKLENIYYDFDKYNIRPDAAKELDRFVAFMKKYPGMVVELRSHTDSRGSDTYNQWLSQKRAESAVDYIIKHGVDKSLISARGYGESKPVNKCVNKVRCTEEEHQQNRRTEFVVVKQPEGLKVKSSVTQ